MMIKLTENRNICKRKKNLVLILLFIISFIGLFPLFQEEMQKTENMRENLILLPKSAEFHSTIFIDSNTELALFCSGNGTDGSSWADAYVIKDYEIDASDSGNVIEIRNTDLFLIIQNCTVTNSGSKYINAGIYLDNCSNVKIIGCNSSFNSNGFYLNSSSNNTLFGNNAWKNSDEGFELINSWGNELSGNKAWSNAADFHLDSSNNNRLLENQGSVHLRRSNNNTLVGNNASNGFYGFNLFESVNNTLLRNIALNNTNSGFRLTWLSDNNTVSGNIAFNNVYNGFYLHSSSNNILSGNNITYNKYYGIFIATESDNNSIFDNLLKNYKGNIQNKGENNKIYNNTLIALPFASFSVKSFLIIEGERGFFTDTSTGGIGAFLYQWNFGDGTTNSTEANPYHVFTSSGKFVVTLTIIDEEGDTHVYSNLVTVWSRPVIIIGILLFVVTVIINILSLIMTKIMRREKRLKKTHTEQNFEKSPIKEISETRGKFKDGKDE